MTADAATDETGSAPFRLGYQPALDGIRGVSVLAVMAFHAGLSWIRGGFLGVDAFFVLSGFLITCLLLEEHRVEGRISLRDFYARRLLRLVPGLLLVLTAVGLYAVVFADPAATDALVPEATSTILYVANWLRAYTTAFPFHLAHTWSLSIEEQFYVLWPLVLVGLLALRSRTKAVMYATVGGALASAVLMLVMTGFGTHRLLRAYYGTDTRAQALLCGCAIAVFASEGLLARSERARRAARSLAWMGAAVVVTLWLVLTGITSPLLFRGAFTLEALGVAAVMVHVLVSPGSVMAKFLASGPLRWIGRISYGLYLWHWPVYLVVGEWNLAFWPKLSVKLLLTFSCATVSFYALERPLLGMKRRFQRSGSGRLSPPAVVVARHEQCEPGGAEETPTAATV